MTTLEDGYESFDARIDFERDSRTPSDFDLEQVASEDEDYASSPADYNISTYPADFTLEILHKKCLDGEIRIPEFQRAFVWKPAQSSKLIESFLLGLPVPPVYVYTERRSQNYLVIDGQQRLKSVFYFFEGYFGEEPRGNRKAFRLTGLNSDSRFKEKTFADFLEEDQRRLRNAVLRSFVVQQLEPDDNTSIYHIFERLNTGGTLLTNQEIRNCVYHGSFTESLINLNKTPEWRRILGKPDPDSRKRDIELLVRFFAMQDISNYKKPMKDFLSRYMKKNQDESATSLSQKRQTFQETCAALVEALGDRPFHVRSGLNAAVSDAVMVAFSEHLGQVPNNIADRYQMLLEDEKFRDSTSKGTTDVNIVKARFLRAEQVLFR